MTLSFFNILWLYFLEKCLFGFRLDTQSLPFSINIMFIPFYKIEYWNCFSKTVQEDGSVEKRWDLLIPYLCDIVLVF